MTALLATTSCTKDKTEICLEKGSTASFKVNGDEFSSLEEKIWLKNGTQHSLQFMQQMPNGDQHVIIVIFNGDTVGNYPLQGINGTHRLSYFAPGINATTFETTVVGGILAITNFDKEPSCLSGNYTFTLDTLEISGQFQSLRPN
tara:strand:+ start:664 stop:1098 length:435 start_codon:yes stop_codon:yes gene_type:complete